MGFLDGLFNGGAKYRAEERARRRSEQGHERVPDYGSSIAGIQSLSHAAAIQFQKDYSRALEAFERGDLGSTLNQLTSLLGMGSRTPDYKEYSKGYLLAGICFQQIGDLGRAIDSTKHALTLDPDYREANTNLGVFYYHNEQLTLAESYLRRAIDLNGGYDSIAGGTLGIILASRGDSAEALPYLEHALDANIRDDDVRRALGMCYIRLGQHDDANSLNKPPYVGGSDVGGSVFRPG